jgi:O-antigen ligase
MVLGNLGRAPVLVRGPEWPVLFNDLLVAAALLASAVACLQARRLRLDALAGFAAAFATVGVGAGLWAAQKYAIAAPELLASYAYLGRWVAYFGLYVAVLNVGRDEDAPLLWAALERAVLAFAAFGVFQVFAFEHFAQTVYPQGGDYITWDYQGRRLVSTLLDPNFAGMLVSLVLLVYVARLAYGVPVRWWKPALLLTALLLTLSRGATLAFVIGLGVVVAGRGLTRRLARAALLAVAAALPILPALIRFAASFRKFSIDESAMARVEAWVRALTVIGDNPIVGVGFNTYRYVRRAYGWSVADNLPAASLDGGLLFIVVLTGAVGLVCYVGLLGLVVARCRRLWRDAGAPAEARALALGTAAGTVALVLHSITVNSLLLPFLMEPHWLLAALVALHARARARAISAGG